MSGSGAGVGEPAPAGRAGGRLPRRLIAAALAVVAGTATACAGMADPEEMTSAASSTSPSSANGYRNGTQIRAEVRYSAADDLPVAHVAIGLDSSVELVITGNPSGPVHLRGYERYAEPAGGSTVLRFVATERGCFVVEHDETGRTIAEVDVVDPDQPSASPPATRTRPGAEPFPRRDAQCARRS